MISRAIGSCFLGCVVLSLTATADLPKFAYGERYEASLSFTLQSHFRKEVIDMRFKDSKTRIEELKKQGYQCQPEANSFYSCKKFFNSVPIPERIVKSLENEFRDSYLIFGKTRRDPELITKGSDLHEWLYHQAVEYNDVLFQEWTYSESSQIRKLSLGELQEFWVSDLSLSRFVFRNTSDLNGYDVYLIQIPYFSRLARLRRRGAEQGHGRGFFRLPTSKGPHQ